MSCSRLGRALDLSRRIELEQARVAASLAQLGSASSMVTCDLARPRLVSASRTVFHAQARTVS